MPCSAGQSKGNVFPSFLELLFLFNSCPAPFALHLCPLALQSRARGQRCRAEQGLINLFFYYFSCFWFLYSSFESLPPCEAIPCLSFPLLLAYASPKGLLRRGGFASLRKRGERRIPAPSAPLWAEKQKRQRGLLLATPRKGGCAIPFCFPSQKGKRSQNQSPK